MTGDEDDGHVGALGELPLQLETVQSWQRDVEHEAARDRGARVDQELLRRCERLGPPPLGSNQVFQRLAHRDVEVDDEDNGVTSGIIATSLTRPAEDEVLVYGAPVVFPVNIVVVLTSSGPRR